MKKESVARQVRVEVSPSRAREWNATIIRGAGAGARHRPHDTGRYGNAFDARKKTSNVDEIFASDFKFLPEL